MECLLEMIWELIVVKAAKNYYLCSDKTRLGQFSDRPR